MKKYLIIIILFVGNFAFAQTNSELLEIQNKFHDFEEVYFAYKSGDKIYESKSIKKSTDYFLYIDMYDVKKIYNSEVIGGLILVKKDGKYGYVNSKAKKVIPIEYDYAQAIKQINGKGEPIIIVKKDKLMGVINTKNKPVLKFEYSNIYSYKSNRALCFKDKRYFFIDQNLNRINDVDYDDAFDFMPNNLAQVVSNGKVGLIDTAGKIVLPIEYDKCLDLKDKFYKFYVITKGDKQGVIDSTGQIIIPLEYDLVKLLPTVEEISSPFAKNDLYFKEDNKVYLNLINEGTFFCVKGKEHFLLNSQSKPIMPVGYKNFVFIGNKNIKATNSEGKFGAFNLNGEIFIPFDYIEMNHYAYNRIVIREESKKYGYLKSDATECSDFRFYKASDFDYLNHGMFEMEYSNGEIREGYVGKNCLLQFGRIIVDTNGRYLSEEEAKVYEGKMTSSNNASVSSNNKSNSTNSNQKTNNNTSSSNKSDNTEKYHDQVYFHFDSNNKSKGEKLYIHYGSNGSYKTSTGVGSDASIKCEAGKVYYSFTGEKKDMILIREIKPEDCKKKFYSKDFVK